MMPFYGRAGSSPSASAPRPIAAPSEISLVVRSLSDCPDVPVGPEGVHCRVVVATHPVGKKKSRVGVTREGLVYELFFTRLPQQGFTASDVVELYLHRGAFEPVLADEDVEQDPDRWGSQSCCGQECWQVVAQWVWNLRLERGHQLHPDEVAHHRVCSCLFVCPGEGGQSPFPSTRIWVTRGGFAQDRWSLLWSRVCPPARWDPALPGRTDALGPRATRSQLMDVCGWWMRPVSAVAAPALCVSHVNGRVVPPKSLARSVCCSTLSWSARPLSSGTIGVADGIDAPASSSCAIRGEMCCTVVTLRPALPCRLQPFLAHNGRIIGSRLLSGSHAMPGSLRQANLSLRSSGCQRPSLPFSDSRRSSELSL